MKQQQTKNEARYEIKPVVGVSGEFLYIVHYFNAAYGSANHVCSVSSKEQAYKAIEHHKQGIEIIEG